MNWDLSKFFRNYYFSSALHNPKRLIEAQFASKHQKRDHQRSTSRNSSHAMNKHVGPFCLLD